MSKYYNTRINQSQFIHTTNAAMLTHSYKFTHAHTPPPLLPPHTQIHTHTKHTHTHTHTHTSSNICIFLPGVNCSLLFSTYCSKWELYCLDVTLTPAGGPTLQKTASPTWSRSQPAECCNRCRTVTRDRRLSPRVFNCLSIPVREHT